MEPQITIVIPVFNREAFIARALNSCLAQTCGDFEVVVVDDGSTDGSCAVVERFTDPRIRLLRQARNRGVGPARNAGIAHARADWLIMLDSDDELVESAVETVVRKKRAADGEIGAFWFRCRLDDGGISPSVVPRYGRLSYVEYLEYLEACLGRKRDMLYCPRRSTFEQVRYPDNFGLEDLYHLDFSKAFRPVICEDILRRYHQDADNQLVKRTARFDDKLDTGFSRDRADVVTAALNVHGAALRQHAPWLYRQYLSRLLVLRLLCGDRGKALAVMKLALSTGGASPRDLLLFTVGMVHPRLLAWLRSGKVRQRFRPAAR
jgi:glycosyltransferase involved in cell wall biosynthesis